ncbi:MAG: aminotransferase class V-fold PLP-dependent enzyme, partial [Pseudomonadota bacterium]
PHQGIMTMNATLAQLLPNQGHWFNADYPSKRFTPAGPDHAQVAACAGMADYMDSLAAHHGVETAQDVHDLMRRHEIEIAQPLLDWANARNDLRLIGPSDAKKRAPTVTLDLGAPAAPVAERLTRHGIMAEAGDFYGSRPLEAMGVDLDQGVLRLSFVHYTAQSDIDKLLNALEDVL